MSSIYDLIINGIAQCFTILNSFDIGGISMLQFALGLMFVVPVVKLLITRVETAQDSGGIKARAKETNAKAKEEAK